MIIFSSVAIREIYMKIGHVDDLSIVKQKVDQLIADLGIVNEDD